MKNNRTPGFRASAVFQYKEKLNKKEQNTYQYTFLAFWIEVTVCTSFKVCFVFFSADLNAYL